MFEKFLEKKGYTLAKFKELEVSKQADIQREYLSELETQVKAKASNQDITKALENFKKDNEIADYKDRIAGLETKITTEKSRVDKLAQKDKSIQNDKPLTIVKSVEENFNDLKEVMKGAKKEIFLKGQSEIRTKAVTNTSSVSNSQRSVYIPEIGKLGVKERTLYSVLPKIPVAQGDHKGRVSYIDYDEATTVRAAKALAEGAAFDQSTVKFQEYEEKLSKIGDTLAVTEEFNEDYQSFAAELELFLDTNVDQKISQELATGDGTGNGFRGIVNRSPSFTAPNLGMTNANLKDLVRKVRTSIVKGRGSKYIPDIVVMNSDTYDDFALAKDGNGQYLFDDNGVIAGLTVVEDNFIPDNTLIVGDRRFARLYEMAGASVSEAEPNNQFNEDMKTIKIRKRVMMLIREVDRTGFAKVTDIGAALTALETAPV